MADIDDTPASGPFGRNGAPGSAIGDATVEVKVVIGTATLRVRDLLKLGRGAVVELDRHVQEPTDVYVEGVMVAHGEITIADDKIGVKLTDFLKSAR